MHTKSKMRNWSMISLFLVLLSIISVSHTILAQGIEKVSIWEAQEAAQIHVVNEAQKGTFPQWENAIPTDGVAYYNPDGSIAAYVFSVVDEAQKDVGFVTISAYEKPVVLEYSPAPAPHKRSETENECITSPILGSKPLIFLGPLLYTFELEVMEKEVRSFQSIDGLRTVHFSNDDLNRETSIWKNYVENTDVPIPLYSPKSFQILATSGVLDVDHVVQGCDTVQSCNCSVCGSQCADGICGSSQKCWVGCTPAAGSSIMKYWNEHGFSNLGSNVKSIMVALHNYMSTSECGATTRTNAAKGIELYTSDKNYDFDAICISTHSGCNGSKPTFQNLINEIDAGNPVILGYAGHANTGIGYDTSGSIAILNENHSGVSDPRYVPWSTIASYSGNSEVGIIAIHPPVDTDPPTINFTVPTQDRWYNTDETISWNVRDDGSGVDYFKWEWDDETPDIRIDDTDGSTQLSVPGQGKHTLYVQAWDEAGNSTSVKNRGWFGYDTADPTAPAISPGCSASDNQWQNTCRDPAFTWRATDPNGDAGSGVHQYAYAWNTSSSSDPATWGDATAYNPGAITSADGVARYYLHIKAKDVAGNTSLVSHFGLWYDGSAPAASLLINEGATTTQQTSIRVGLTASDTGSGVSEVRLSHNGLYWDPWQPYTDEVAWVLPALDRRELPVYAQVRDGAGNLSAVVSDTITLDLYPVMPHSASYRICDDVFDAGGSSGANSTSYTLVSSIGQPWASGAQANLSAAFTERAGFLSSTDGCRPIRHTVTDNFDIHQWVVASGGNLRSSASYQLGDTTGESAASGANAFSSANYTLSSGFWATTAATQTPGERKNIYLPLVLRGGSN